MEKASRNKRKLIDYSIIIPVYCNQEELEKTYQAIINEVVKHNPTRSYEIIFIDDGSLDSSFDKMMELKSKNPHHIKIIKFTRNFGQVSAIRAGLEYSSGQCVVNISADMQDPPELINDMLGYHFKEGFSIVICKRDAREESLFRRKTSKFFYKIMKKLSFPNMPEGGFDYFLIGSKVKDAMIRTKEANPFLQGQILWTGYPIKFIPYQRKKRETGTSKWTFGMKIKYLIDGVMAYSYFPLRFMTIMGIIISSLGFLYAIAIFFIKIFGGIPVKGWAPIMIVLLILSGFQMLMLGVIGEYVWRTLEQVRRRDHYIIDKIYD
jgi:dolichol-phosphate mannosyltransferase